MTRPDGPAARVRHGVRRHRLRQVPRSDPAPTQVALFPDDPAAPDLDCEVVQVRLSGLRPSRRERGQSPLERAFLTQLWSFVGERVDVKLLARDEDVYILARSRGRQDQERARRRWGLKRLCQWLKELQRQQPRRDHLPLKREAAVRRPVAPTTC